MKKLFLTLVSVFVLATVAFAQDDFNRGNRQRGQRMNPAEMVQRRTESMAKEYNLTAEQTEKVKALNEKFFTRERGRRQESTDSLAAQRSQRRPNMDGQRRGQRAEGGERQRGMGERMGAPRMGGQRGGFAQQMEEYNKELKEILTPEQYSAYEENMKKMQRRK